MFFCLLGILGVKITKNERPCLNHRILEDLCPCLAALPPLLLYTYVQQYVTSLTEREGAARFLDLAAAAAAAAPTVASSPETTPPPWSSPLEIAEDNNDEDPTEVSIAVSGFSLLLTATALLLLLRCSCCFVSAAAEPFSPRTPSSFPAATTRLKLAAAAALLVGVAFGLGAGFQLRM